MAQLVTLSFFSQQTNLHHGLQIFEAMKIYS